MLLGRDIKIGPLTSLITLDVLIFYFEVFDTPTPHSKGDIFRLDVKHDSRPLEK